MKNDSQEWSCAKKQRKSLKKRKRRSTKETTRRRCNETKEELLKNPAGKGDGGTEAVLLLYSSDWDMTSFTTTATIRDGVPKGGNVHAMPAELGDAFHSPLPSQLIRSDHWTPHLLDSLEEGWSWGRLVY